MFLFLGDFRKIFSPYTENPVTELWYKGINADTNIQTLLHPSEASLQRQSRRIRFFQLPDTLVAVSCMDINVQIYSPYQAEDQASDECQQTNRVM